VNRNIAKYNIDYRPVFFVSLGAFHLFQDGESVDDSTDNTVHIVEMGCSLVRNEKLRAILVRPTVGH
jgi:hypothetical protein